MQQTKSTNYASDSWHKDDETVFLTFATFLLRKRLSKMVQ